MGRQAREFGKTGIYHILFRGVNHCCLFEEDADFEKYLSAVKAVKATMSFDLYAYALMSNHVHLLIREKSTGDIAVVMRKVLTQYAGWFNRKYGRSGALIANRYKSECVEDEPNKAAGMQKTERNAAIALLRANGFSIRQAERLTGVPRGIVGRC
jgi:REP element-mobilizing transposase RayT